MTWPLGTGTSSLHLSVLCSSSFPPTPPPPTTSPNLFLCMSVYFSCCPFGCHFTPSLLTLPVLPWATSSSVISTLCLSVPLFLSRSPVLWFQIHLSLYICHYLWSLPLSIAFIFVFISLILMSLCLCVSFVYVHVRVRTHIHTHTRTHTIPTPSEGNSALTCKQDSHPVVAPQVSEPHGSWHLTSVPWLAHTDTVFTPALSLQLPLLPLCPAANSL